MDELAAGITKIVFLALCVIEIMLHIVVIYLLLFLPTRRN